MSSDSEVVPAYTGVWTNWNYGPVKGATLTIPTGNASFLVAFLAVLVGIVGGHFWSILCYVLFQIKSTTKPRDGQHHQHQVIFRNYHTDVSALGEFLNSTWYWRRKSRMPALAALPWALLALAHALAFIIAGVLSARVSLVTSGESEVLVMGPTCGFWANPSTSDINANRSTMQPRVDYFSNLVQDFAVASTMATLCSNKSSGAGDCNSYAPQQIEWSMTPDVPCPFAPEMCVENKAVRFDSGPISSDNHLGINTPEADRFSYRSVIECAPITRDGFMQDWHDMNGTILTTPNITNPMIITDPGEEYLEFFYGPNYWVGLNSTFLFSSSGPSYTMWSNQKFSLGGVHSILGFPEASPFSPIPELNRTDADVNLLFLGQDQMRYSGPVEDPWFEAHEPSTQTLKIEFDAREEVTTYHSKYPISVVGCACQYQYCGRTMNGTACTPLTGLDASLPKARGILKSPKQRGILRRWIEVVGSVGDMSRLATALAGNVLLANQFGTIELHPLPNDHWIQELNHMFGTLMAALQIRNYRYVGGYGAGSMPKVTPPWDNQTWMCGSQKVRRSDYQSFSVLGIGIIIGLGAFIILVDLALSSVVGSIQRRFHKREHAPLEWDLLKTKTLQRLAYSGQGVEMQSGLHSIQPVLGAFTTAAPYTTQGSLRRQNTPPTPKPPTVSELTRSQSGGSSPAGGGGGQVLPQQTGQRENPTANGTVQQMPAGDQPCSANPQAPPTPSLMAARRG